MSPSASTIRGIARKSTATTTRMIAAAMADDLALLAGIWPIPFIPAPLFTHIALK